MDQLWEMLPFLIPLAVAQFALLAWSLYHVLTHTTYKCGTRLVWVLVSLLSFVGPIAYFLLGREDE